MKLIDKSALVAEIERRMDDLYDYLPDASKVENGKITISEACNTGKYTSLESFRNYIDTLEVKEVDLDGERRKYLTEHFNVYEDGILQSKRSNLPLDTYDVIKIAKHHHHNFVLLPTMG